jgi:hypothetical protein
MLTQIRGCYPPDCCSPSSILTLRLASTSAASTAAWAFSRRRCSTAYSGAVSQWRASAFSAASSPASPERSRAVYPWLRPAGPAVPLLYLPNTLRHQGLCAPSCVPPVADRGSALFGSPSTVSGDSEGSMAGIRSSAAANR